MAVAGSMTLPPVSCAASSRSTRRALAARHRQGAQQRRRYRSERQALGRLDHPWQLAPRHRHPQQRALCRQAGLESPALLEGSQQAAEALRALIDEIRLTSAPDGILQVELYGELGAILALGQDTNVNRPGDVPRRFSLVAGTRNCLDLLLSASGRSEVYSASQLAETDS